MKVVELGKANTRMRVSLSVTTLPSHHSDTHMYLVVHSSNKQPTSVLCPFKRSDRVSDLEYLPRFPFVRLPDTHVPIVRP